MSKKATGSTRIDHKTKIRLLLNLWSLGGKDTPLSRRELTEKVKLSKETSGDYEKLYEELQIEGAIAVTLQGRSSKVSLTEKGLEILENGRGISHQ